jgi:thiamine pyrophosphokinase
VSKKDETLWIVSITEHRGSQITRSRYKEIFQALMLAMSDIDIESVLSGMSETSGIIVINSGPLSSSLPLLWGRSHMRICADGGANVLLNSFGTTLKPDLILGDLDSLTPFPREEWSRARVEIELDSDQDTTDLEKCLKRVPSSPLPLLIAGDVGGRLDQTFSIINCLFKEAMAGRTIILIGGTSSACILHPGTSTLNLPRFMVSGKCGLIPMFGICHSVSTRGLRWNLQNETMGFGGSVSTSNIIDSHRVVIESDGFLLWTNSF